MTSLETMRKRMIKTADKYGRQHPKTLAMSRKVDKLVVEIMKEGQYESASNL
ncbi:MAG TPA: Spo0E family sporulation regulatory protein-aspartic acid phosphatase [Desulfosporosinus sp.]|nr:Spo0E family sporulation regulatory protein-aspartic acid phosphatase [Desulfosporosinus sp.]